MSLLIYSHEIGFTLSPSRHLSSRFSSRVIHSPSISVASSPSDHQWSIHPSHQSPPTRASHHSMCLVSSTSSQVSLSREIFSSIHLLGRDVSDEAISFKPSDMKRSLHSRYEYGQWICIHVRGERFLRHEERVPWSPPRNWFLRGCSGEPECPSTCCPRVSSNSHVPRVISFFWLALRFQTVCSALRQRNPIKKS